jgi:hypothetical protein
LLEKIIDETRINVDVSLFLPHATALEPVVYYWEGRKRLVRLPYMWEDDFEMVRPDSIWDLGGMIDRGMGLMIMDFHPIHVYLNSMTLASYRSVQAMGRLVDLPGGCTKFYRNWARRWVRLPLSHRADAAGRHGVPAGIFGHGTLLFW